MSFEYHSCIKPRGLVSHQVVQRMALNADKGEQLQDTLF